jgi:predicted nucleic acid-binding protein
VIHLDTSFLVRGLVPGTDEDAALRRWLEQGESVGISTIAWTEFLCGPVESPQIAAVERILDVPTPFAGEDSSRAAGLFNATGRRRGSLLDCMIAAVALRCEARLATSNRADFERFEDRGLTLA